MIQINKCSFVIFNFAELVVLLYMLVKIKNIKDELNIKVEINILILLWLIFSIIYFVTNTIYDL